MTTNLFTSSSVPHVRRILIICRSLKVGGIERVSVELANALAHSGHEVHLLRLKAPLELTPTPSVSLHLKDLDKQLRQSIPGALYNLLTRLILAPLLPGSGFLWRGLATSRLLKGQVKALEAEHGPFDLIVTRGQGAFEQHWRWQDPRLWQVVESWPGGQAPGWLERLYLRCLHDGKQIVCVSPSVRRRLVQLLDGIDVRPEAITDIPNPCDIEAIRLLAWQGEVPHPRPYIVHVARLSRVKQQSMLIRAYARAELDEDLVIVGEGPMRKHLEKLISELGLEERVYLVGQQTNPYSWMCHARLFVLCSSSEGLG
uniref:glycosyltransferase n=1 Tax=Halomonas sp. PR-M31 TaxID=1471202 RepID=UPI000A6D7A89